MSIFVITLSIFLKFFIFFRLFACYWFWIFHNLFLRFADEKSKDKTVFPFYDDPDKICKGFEEVLERYEELVKNTIKLSGPSSFAPLIDAAIDIIKKEQSYHILVIITDGIVDESCLKLSSDAIVRASHYPM